MDFFLDSKLKRTGRGKTAPSFLLKEPCVKTRELYRVGSKPHFSPLIALSCLPVQLR
jgi:hypothetical protein